ncbi:MAG TPA: flagellar basal-body MS-ring/collar protein FliF [Paucimonas sp.]|nr:flagellar basal-body MS-ring/collar protein FliF [Paucimonas sp.]
MVGAAAVIAVMAGVWLWSQQPEYRVLFSNYSDRDGGAIVAALQQQNIPYKFAEGGTAILVPANQVYDARLKLAAQGLPKGGSVGFELMENQKLGVSQFLEQVNFQRALEGELARSIQSVAAVQAARVHLALPKASVFVRDQQKPTASVLLNLHPGRVLDQPQVSAIVHLVASSVPELSPKNVTIVDQAGNLLSDTTKPAGANALDPSQLKYVQELQQSIVKRIESIITPIVGRNNVRAEATADVDFSHSEQAAEVYKPNQAPGSSSIRSQQSSEIQSATGTTASGIPGAASNQPPGVATAPLTAPAGAATQGAAAAGAAPAGNSQRDMTVNYEVDKTIRYVQQPMGGIKRLSVAVVVNYKREVDKAGKVTTRPLTEAEKTQIADLVKEAMGYNKDRGDTLNVVNSPFAGAEKEVIPETPIWKRPETYDIAREVGKYALGLGLLAYLFFGVLRPMLKKLGRSLQPPPPPPVYEEEEDTVTLSQMEPMGKKPRSYQDNLDAAKQLAKEDPKVVANIIKGWVGVSNNE